MGLLGYVRAYKPELRFREYDVYKGVYCTLCKTLLRRYSPLGQLFLSYDASFFALVLLSLQSDSLCEAPSRCCWNPMKKCLSCGRGDVQDFCADLSVLLFYYKISDDLHDRGFWRRMRSLLAFPIASLMRRKAARLRPEADALVSRMMRTQREREAQNASLDAAAEPSADALASLAALRVDDPSVRHFFYLLGRYVYLIDAVDDVRDDIRKQNFNPLKEAYLREPDAFYTYALGLLNLNIGELVKAFEALEVRRYRDIVYNVIFDGLYNSALFVLKKYQKGEASA